MVYPRRRELTGNLQEWKLGSRPSPEMQARAELPAGESLEPGKRDAVVKGIIQLESNNLKGRVYLTGAGPGDPELLTLKARRVLEEADCVLYDNLINRQILEYVPQNAELVFVGKVGHGEGSITQAQINELMIQRAGAGMKVVRLKGGDPFVYGRGAEEAIELAKAGIHWEIIPGISSGIAAPAYSGIPVTHRGLSRSVAFVTGHEASAGNGDYANWQALARGVDTIVVFMGLARISAIARELVDGGRPEEALIAVISSGTTVDQKVVIGTLKAAMADGFAAGLTSPALLVIGEVVGLRDELDWLSGSFESQ